jgi:hypothetical protein
VRISQVPPGAPAQVEVATSGVVGGQLALAQHVVFPMQTLPQTTWFAGQLHVPPGPEQVSVEMGQLAVVQHSVDGMHRLFAVQNVCPAGQLHEPPGPEQLPPPVQSAFVQHCPWAMHALKGGDVMVQTEPLFGQTQLPPAPVQVWPVTRQSLLVQHVFVGMHELLTVHTLFPEAQAQVPPGAGHVSPVTVQSVFVQQSVLGMQELLATQAL